jgi:hypothetical protein
MVQNNVTMQQALPVMNAIQASAQQRTANRLATLSAAGLVPTPGGAPAPAPTQAQLTASLQDAIHTNDVNRLRALSWQIGTSGQPALQARAAAITSNNAWGVAQTMNAPVK